MWVIKYVVRVSIRLVKLFIPETILFREYHMKCWMRHALEYQYDEIVNIFSVWIKIFYITLAAPSGYTLISFDPMGISG